MTNSSAGSVNLYKVYSNGIAESKDFTTTKFNPEIALLSGYKGTLGEVEECVKEITFSDLLTECNVTEIEFLKVDIEGGEYEALMNTDLSMVTGLVIEIHYSFLGKEKVRELILHLMKYLNFLHKKDEIKFLHQFPPPDILQMVNYNKFSFYEKIKLLTIMQFGRVWNVISMHQS